MKPMYVITIVCILSLGIGYAGAQVSKDEKKDYPLDEQNFTQSNCQILAIKNLQASTTEQDLTRQQVDINTAHSYQELAQLGAEC